MKVREVVTPAATVGRLLAAASDGEVLVGGQALVVWVEKFGVRLPRDLISITADVDFLARSAGDVGAVSKFARVISGQVVLPSEHALTSVVGQAFRQVGDDTIVNVDVVHRLVGLTTEQVRKGAITVEAGGVRFLVMHPIHVLASRLANLHELADKQNDKGRHQLALAISVAREYLRSLAQDLSPQEVGTGRSVLQTYVKFIAKLAKDDAGVKVARRHHLHVADAIDPQLIPAGPFWAHHWDTLKARMSPTYAASFEVLESERRQQSALEATPSRPSRKARNRP